MAHHPKPSLLAGFYETTQGTPPADSAAWVSGAVRFHHIAESLTVDSFVETALDDMRSVDRIVTGRPIIRGIKGGNEFPFELYLTGHEDTSIAGGETVTATALSNLLANCWGGQHRAPTMTAGVGSTTTALVVDSTTGLVAGDFIGWADSNSVVHYREVASVDSSTEITLRRALPSAPANSNLIYGAITIFLDEDVLVDSSDGPSTMSWLIEKATNRNGSPNSYHRWVARGCGTSLTGLTMTRNELARLSFATLVGSFLGPGEHSIAPSWSASPTGVAGKAMGPTTKCWFIDSGTTTNTQSHLVEFAIDSLFRKAAIPTMTEAEDNMPGLYGYGLTADNVAATLTFVPFANDFYTDFTNGTYKHLQVERAGTLGTCFSVSMGRCSLQSTPIMTPGDVTSQHSVSVRADVDNLSTTAQGTSPIKIVLG